MKKCIYTFIIGDYDNIKEPKIVTPGWDYICVTDNPNLKSNIWRIITVNDTDRQIHPNKKRAMSVKIGYKNYLPTDYDVVITIDGSIVINTDLDVFLQKCNYTDKVDACFIIHPNRDCVYDEAKTIVQVARDTLENISKQVNYFREQGYPTNNGLYASGLMVINNQSPITKFFELWRNEYLNLPSVRDQMAFNYSKWKYEKHNDKLNINNLRYADVLIEDFYTTNHLKTHNEAMNLAVDLEKKVNEVWRTPSDINEHIPTLLKYGQECEHITEMGVRGIQSTWAFLGSAPKKMHSYDIQDPKEWQQDINVVYETAKQYGLNFEFTQANVLEIEIEPTELLFIDTWHAYKQLKAELELHADKASKYIVLHDTTSFESHDETSYEVWGDEWKGDGKGIWPAIEEFLESNSNWALHERYTNNNGLTILKRVG